MECQTKNLNELPKLPAEVAECVTKGLQLKHVETTEKNVLPTTLGIILKCCI